MTTQSAASIIVVTIIAALALSYLLGSHSREPEISELQRTSEHDSIEIEALGEEVKQCRNPKEQPNG